MEAEVTTIAVITAVVAAMLIVITLKDVLYATTVSTAAAAPASNAVMKDADAEIVVANIAVTTVMNAATA